MAQNCSRAGVQRLSHEAVLLELASQRGSVGRQNTIGNVMGISFASVACWREVSYHAKVFVAEAFKICKPHPLLDPFWHQGDRLLERHDHMLPVAFGRSIGYHA